MFVRIEVLVVFFDPVIQKLAQLFNAEECGTNVMDPELGRRDRDCLVSEPQILYWVLLPRA